MSSPLKSTIDHANPIPAPIRLGFRLMPKISEGLTARAAEHLFCRPRRFQGKAEERAWLANAAPFPLRVGKQTLEGYSWGQGPTVLLVHGWEGRAGQMTPLVPALCEAGFRVVTWDALGHGDSPGRTSSFVAFVDGIWAAMRAVGDVHGIVAHSMGAAASGLALHEGLEVRKTVFIAPPYSMEFYADEFARLLGLSASVHERMVRSMERRFAIRLSELSFDNVELPNPDSLLMIHDVEDQEVPFELSERIVQRWPSVRLLATRGLGHKRILRDAQVVRSVTRYLKQDAPITKADGLVLAPQSYWMNRMCPL